MIDPNITEEQQWAEWSKRHPNPSGLPEEGLIHEHRGRTVHIVRRASVLREAPAHLAGLHAKLLARGLPGIVWKPSPNYTPGRAGHNPNWTQADPNTWLVFHTMVGWMANTIISFQSVARQASSTYAIGLNGGMVMFVHEEDAPWTNGTMQGIGSNLDAITIEGEDGGNFNGPRTPQFYEAYAVLVEDIHKRRAIPLLHRGAGGGCLGHHECTGAQTSCPDGLNVNGIIARAVALDQPAPPPDTRPEWLRNLAKLATPASMVLAKPVNVYSLNPPKMISSVPAGPLTVAYQTSVGGQPFWVTAYGSTRGNGLLKSDVEAALAPTPTPGPSPVPPSPPTPSPVPTPVPVNPPAPVPPQPPADALDWLRQLFAWLKDLFHL